MAKSRVARATPLRVVPQRDPQWPESEPGFIAIQLRGLARLITHASYDGVNVPPVEEDLAYFLTTTLEDFARKLESYEAWGARTRGVK